MAGMNQHNAAVAAGYSETYARQACRIEKLVKVSILDTLERVGLTDKYQAEKLLELTKTDNQVIRLNALKHISELKRQVSGVIVNQNNHTHFTKIYVPEPYNEQDIERMASSQRPTNRSI